MNLLDDKIVELERSLDKLEHRVKAKSANMGKKKNVCVCQKCPSNSIAKNEIVFGQISLGSHDLCLYPKCPKGSRPTGKIHSSLTNKKENLCIHDKCPKGCLPFVSYVNSGGNLYNINNKKNKKK